MKSYDHKKIESKWQKAWEDARAFAATEDSKKKKTYLLVEFPYPSGDGLHVGHVRSYTALDVIARKRRAEGENVLYPMGWDAFGLPTENYAIKTGIHPKEVTKKNTDNFRRQLKSLGFSFDWDREINTTDPAYYKWTQWIFLKLFEQGLAYKARMPINWCLSCKIGLANEEVVDGGCERCGNPVEKREKEQWMLKITEYADRLEKDLDEVDFWERIKAGQRNWIGRSEGAELFFELDTGKRHYVILHAYGATPDDNFYPWLKEELLARGHSVEVLELPHTEDPNIPEQIDFVLNHAHYDEHTVIVGHSLGTISAMKMVEALPAPIHKLVLAAPFIDPHFKDNRRPFEDTFDWKFDFEKIRRNAGEIVVLEDAGDYAISRDQYSRVVHALSAERTTFAAEAPHMLGAQEPEVLRAVLDGVRVFTTRPDTLFGVTYITLAPEHPFIARELLRGAPHIKNADAIREYQKAAARAQESERTAVDREKTGVVVEGISAIHPATGERIPVYLSDYVLGGYGTGAVMAVPMHDERDFKMAETYDLPRVPVIKPDDEDLWEAVKKKEACFTGEGVLVHSDSFDGLSSQEARQRIVAWLSEKGLGKDAVQYKLRDWVFSRQRYWGEPIPIVHCKTCGPVAVPEKDLPVVLPDVVHYEPTDTGESPLAAVTDWVHTACPKCGGPGERETDTMPNWAGSSWYYLRYTDPHNDKSLASSEHLSYWTPVDWYNGGMEHTTLHLLYSRFWHKFLFDIGVVPTNEPYAKRTSHGLILAEGGVKMSKSKGNVVNPDEVVDRVGADTLRVYEMFMGPFDQAIAWNTDNMVGSRRWLERVWRLSERCADTSDESVERMLHETIKKVSADIEEMKFNTAVAQMMACVNKAEEGAISHEDYGRFIRLLAPFAPHITEEIWRGVLGHTESVHSAPWPQYDEEKLVEGTMRIAVQIDGKVRAVLTTPAEESEETIKAKAQEHDRARQWIADRKIVRVIYVPGKLVSIVTEGK